MNRLRVLHAWLHAHSAYFFAAMALFPQIWLDSPDLQALLPATWVSRIAQVVAVVAFLAKMRTGLRTLPKPDDTDKAGS